MKSKLRFVLPAATLAVALGILAGFEWGRRANPAPIAAAPAPKAQSRVLYWYDPMQPTQHFDKPGTSPFMDMPLVPKYAAAESAETAGVTVDPKWLQNLGIRLATVERSDVNQAIDVPGNVMFSERLVATVQARTPGFVSRTYARAAGDVVGRDAPLVDLLVPDWAAAQTEYLALLSHGDAALVAAARQRLVLLGMPETLIAEVTASHTAHSQLTVVAPIAGVIETLDAQAGMSIATGATLAKIQGLNPIWIEASVPEAQGNLAALGKAAAIRCTAYPGVPFRGRIVGVLPQTNLDSHTLRVRIEVPNPTGQLKPGMFAQVQLGTQTTHGVVLIPTEAVIHTGTRDLVIVADAVDRFAPVEVRVGAEYGARTSIVSGLAEGQRVVASGQFLIDSEATLRGITARMSNAGKAAESPDATGAAP